MTLPNFIAALFIIITLYLTAKYYDSKFFSWFWSGGLLLFFLREYVTTSLFSLRNWPTDLTLIHSVPLFLPLFWTAVTFFLILIFDKLNAHRDFHDPISSRKILPVISILFLVAFGLSFVFVSYPGEGSLATGPNLNAIIQRIVLAFVDSMSSFWHLVTLKVLYRGDWNFKRRGTALLIMNILWLSMQSLSLFIFRLVSGF